jgi:nitroreductase
MEFADVIRARRMVRRFDTGRSVPPDALDRVLASALRAPSAGFSQGFDFVVLVDAPDVSAYWSLTTDEDGAADTGIDVRGASHTEGDRAEAEPAARPPDPVEARRRAWLDGVRAAPVLVLCCSHKDAYLDRYAEPDKGWTDRDEARWPVPYWDIDTGMAALLMLLTAVDEGLGALFFGVPPEYHDGVQELFAIPRDRTLVGVVALGYAASTGPDSVRPPASGRSRQRRPAGEVVHFHRFGTSERPV